MSHHIATATLAHCPDNLSPHQNYQVRQKKRAFIYKYILTYLSQTQTLFKSYHEELSSLEFELKDPVLFLFLFGLVE